MDLKIVFFGTPPLSATILEYLIDQGLDIVAIVTRPDKPQGRSQKILPSAVKALAEEKWPKIPVFTPEKASTENFAERMKEFNPDVFVVVSYGEIIKENLLSIPRKKCINVHFSLLPKYRGAAPMQRSIMEGETETGITLIEMVLKMDAGDILEVVKVPLREDQTFGGLQQQLTELSGPALVAILEKIAIDEEKHTPQDHSEMTLAPKIALNDRIIDWSKSAREIHNQVRGLSPSPGAFTSVELEGEVKRLGIKRTKICQDLSGIPGETIVWDKNQWIVACGKGALALLEVQLEGKKTLPIQDFLRGQSKPLLLRN